MHCNVWHGFACSQVDGIDRKTGCSLLRDQSKLAHGEPGCVSGSQLCGPRYRHILPRRQRLQCDGCINPSAFVCNRNAGRAHFHPPRHIPVVYIPESAPVAVFEVRRTVKPIDVKPQVAHTLTPHAKFRLFPGEVVPGCREDPCLSLPGRRGHWNHQHGKECRQDNRLANTGHSFPGFHHQYPQNLLTTS